MGSIQTQWTEGKDHSEKRKILIALAPFWFSGIVLAHWLSSLAMNEGKKQVTTGDPSTLQSIIVTSERLIAETKCPVYYCANSLKLSSCATESHWKGFWQPDPSSWTTPSSDLKDEWENIKAWRTQKCELEFLWSGNGPSLLNTLFRNPSWGKLETIQYYSS